MILVIRNYVFREYIRVGSIIRWIIYVRRCREGVVIDYSFMSTVRWVVVVVMYG